MGLTLAVLALVAGGLCGPLAAPAQAQMHLGRPFTPPLYNGSMPWGGVPLGPLVPRLGTLNNGTQSVWWMNPYMTLNQFAYNSALLGRGLRNLAPFAPLAYGYNPYLTSGSGLPIYARLAATRMGMYGGGYGLYGSYGGYGLYGGGYGGYGGYGMYNPYMLGYTPSYGYLQGSASVINANGQYYVMTQEARIKREKSRQEMINTRRKLFDELMYERKMTPTAEQIRQRDLKTALDRARRQPPPGDITSARALNDLFDNLVRDQSLLNNGPTVPIGEDTLAGINFSNGSNGNVGLLKQNRLTWPQALEGSQFKEPRERLSELFTKAREGVLFNGGRANAGTIRDMSNDLNALQHTLDASVGELSPTQFVAAQRFLHQLKDAIQALTHEGVRDLIKPAGLDKVRNVSDLVRWMNRNGLTFAPATQGDAASYRTLYNALVNFDTGAVATTRK